MTNFNDDPRTPSNLNRVRSGRWSSGMWIIAAAIVVVLLFVIGRMSTRTDMVEQRAAAPEPQTTQSVAPSAPATPALQATPSAQTPAAPEQGSKP